MQSMLEAMEDMLYLPVLSCYSVEIVFYLLLEVVRNLLEVVGKVLEIVLYMLDVVNGV